MRMKRNKGKKKLHGLGGKGMERQTGMKRRKKKGAGLGGREE